MSTTGKSRVRGHESPDTTSPLLEVSGLRMRYGDTDVLRGVDLHVDRGEVVCLLGPNGAGKTTTIEILEGYRRRSGGHVRVLGADPEDVPETWRADVGVVLQSWRDHARWQVRQLIDHMGRYYAAYSTPDRPRPWGTDELLSAVGLNAQANQKIQTLSGGQRRRLDVAIGIVGRPRLVFMDEPTAGFDPEARREFHELIHRLSDTDDTTILLTTHDLSEAERLADRIIILAQGRIIADGSADALGRMIATGAEVRWTVTGERHVHSTDDATTFVRDLLNQPGPEIEDLEVRRASLEDTYLKLVAESAQTDDLTEVVA